MKKILMLKIFMLTLIGTAFGQLPDRGYFDQEIEKVLNSKIAYEKSSPSSPKNAAFLSIYKKEIQEFKTLRKAFLKFYRSLPKEKSEPLFKESVQYKYFNPLLSNINFKTVFIKKTDLYSLIKYSLFKKNDSILPENFRGLPIVDERNYNKYDKSRQAEFKAASNYLLKTLKLNRQQSRFIKNDINQRHVLDIKAYLDLEGYSTENQEFITWALISLIQDPTVSLSYLDNVYDAIRHQGYVPKDRL